MWADAQRDRRPAEYRWRPLRKFRNFIPYYCTMLQSSAEARCWSAMQWRCQYTRNSSGDQIANVNFYDDIVHVEANAYAHWTDFLISTK